ncbi:MAG: LytR C-terminal domain-containing protein [Gemmatimonadota bacterium]|jgi:hypothetical protein
MKQRSVANLERLGLVAAWIIAGAFVVSFGRGLSWPFRSTVETMPALPQRVAIDPGNVGGGRIEVLNGTNRGGLARAVTERLRDAGFDVVEIGNYRTDPLPDSSFVIDRSGDPTIARSVADRLGIRSVVTRPDSTLFVDATVILGADWRRD